MTPPFRSMDGSVARSSLSKSSGESVGRTRAREEPGVVCLLDSPSPPTKRAKKAGSSSAAIPENADVTPVDDSVTPVVNLDEFLTTPIVDLRSPAERSELDSPTSDPAVDEIQPAGPGTRALGSVSHAEVQPSAGDVELAEPVGGDVAFAGHPLTLDFNDEPPIGVVDVGFDGPFPGAEVHYEPGRALPLVNFNAFHEAPLVDPNVVELLSDGVEEEAPLSPPIPPDTLLGGIQGDEHLGDGVTSVPMAHEVAAAVTDRVPPRHVRDEAQHPEVRRETSRCGTRDAEDECVFATRRSRAAMQRTMSLSRLSRRQNSVYGGERSRVPRVATAAVETVEDDFPEVVAESFQVRGRRDITAPAPMTAIDRFSHPVASRRNVVSDSTAVPHSAPYTSLRAFAGPFGINAFEVDDDDDDDDESSLRVFAPNVLDVVGTNSRRTGTRGRSGVQCEEHSPIGASGRHGAVIDLEYSMPTHLERFGGPSRVPRAPEAVLTSVGSRSREGGGTSSRRPPRVPGQITRTPGLSRIPPGPPQLSDTSAVLELGSEQPAGNSNSREPRIVDDRIPTAARSRGISRQTAHTRSRSRGHGVGSSSLARIFESGRTETSTSSHGQHSAYENWGSPADRLRVQSSMFRSFVDRYRARTSPTRRSAAPPASTQQWSAMNGMRFIGPASLHHHGALGWSYEVLLSLDDRVMHNRRASDEVIASLKTRKATISDKELRCCICMCDVEEGDMLRKLPCGHELHRDCIDQWLKRDGCCPIDKRRVG